MGTLMFAVGERCLSLWGMILRVILQENAFWHKSY